MIKFSFEVLPAEVNDGVRVTASAIYCEPIQRDVFPELGKIDEETLKMMASVFVPMFESKFEERIAQRIAADLTGVQ